MSTPESKIAIAKTVISTIGSVAAAAMVVRSVAREYLPPEIKDYLALSIRNFISHFSTQLTLVIYESIDGHFSTNEIYSAALSYLTSKITPANHRLTVSKHKKNNSIDVSIESDEAIQDTFNGIKFNWISVSRKTPKASQFNRYNRTSTVRSEERSFELSFHRKHKEMVVNEYLPFILNEAKLKKENSKVLKIFTVHGKDMYSSKPSTWTSVNLDHPATFETLAMDPDVKESVKKDLEKFVRSKEYYRKVGKAWKRGYLLYGPPGTGKSSLIAAIANYLKFDIYDLELTDIKRNSELRRLLVATANRSILVVEDIDCSAELHDRVVVEAQARALALSKAKENYPYPPVREETKMTLSGFLNFIDGLWSSCGDERIIIFTTNHKEKLDPALLRPGRMDVQIHMSYCTPYGFRLLVSNYLGITDHGLFGEINQLIQTTEVTPAEVAEQLLKDDDPDISLGGLVDFLHEKQTKAREAVTLKAKKVEVNGEKS